MKIKKRKVISIVLAGLNLACSIQLYGCGNGNETYTSISGLDTDKEATIIITIPYETNKALNTVANEFMNKYPNISIQLQYIEDYDTNAMQLFKENAVDIVLMKDLIYTEYTEKMRKQKKRF